MRLLNLLKLASMKLKSWNLILREKFMTRMKKCVKTIKKKMAGLQLKT